MQKIRTTITLIAVSLVFLCGFLAFPIFANAQSAKDAACEGVAMTGGDCSSNASFSVEHTVKTVIYIFSWIVGVVSVIMIIVGGLKYVTSNGDSNNVNSAKNTILYAVIGLIVVAMAQVIVKFVLKQVD